MAVTVVAGSALRALPWRRPPKKRYIEPIEAAIKRLESTAETGRGPINDALYQAAPLFGDGAPVRSRRMRKEARRNLTSLAQALVASADLASGFLGSPRGDRWDRHDWGRLDLRAFGPRVENERSFRRTQRHARTLAALGFINTTEIKVPAGPGKWRSVIAIKRLTPAFYGVLGLTPAVARARRERDRKKGEARTVQLAEVVTKRAAKNRGQAAPGRANDGAYQPFRRDGAPKPPDPGPSGGPTKPASETIAELSKRFGR